MKHFAVTLALLLSAPVLAHEVPCVSVEVSDPIITPESVAPVSPEPATSALDETSFMKIVYTSVATGDWWAAASALLVLVVTLIRKYGKQLHELIPDENPADKVFWFFLDTKPGGWVLNLLTTIAGGVGAAMLAGETVNWALVKPILMVSITGASLWELVKDIGGFLKENKKATDVPVQ